MLENNIGKIVLGFRVDPKWLAEKTFVPDAVKVIFSGHYPIKFMQLKLLGGSGLEMFFNKFPFEFEKKKAHMLLRKDLVRKVRDVSDEDYNKMFSSFITS